MYDLHPTELGPDGERRNILTRHPVISVASGTNCTLKTNAPQKCERGEGEERGRDGGGDESLGEREAKARAKAEIARIAAEASESVFMTVSAKRNCGMRDEKRARRIGACYRKKKR